MVESYERDGLPQGLLSLLFFEQEEKILLGAQWSALNLYLLYER